MLGVAVSPLALRAVSMPRCMATATVGLAPPLRRQRREFLVGALAAAPLPARAGSKRSTDCVREAALTASRDPDTAAALLRLAFHDAVTRKGRRGGPNGSVRYELSRSENLGPTLEAAVRALEPVVRQCQVSWADAIAVGGAAAVEASGGPIIEVGTGRTDSLEADPDGLLPDPGLTAGAIRDFFAERLGLTDEETVALCGAHTLGRWTSFIDVSKECLSKEEPEQWACSRREGRRLPFTEHPGRFNSEYFQALVEWYQRRQAPAPTKRWKDRPEDRLAPLNLLPSDVGLLFDGKLRTVVSRFASDEPAFFAAFARAYLKLVD